MSETIIHRLECDWCHKGITDNDNRAYKPFVRLNCQPIEEKMSSVEFRLDICVDCARTTPVFKSIFFVPEGR